MRDNLNYILTLLMLSRHCSTQFKIAVTRCAPSEDAKGALEAHVSLDLKDYLLQAHTSRIEVREDAAFMRERKKIQDLLFGFGGQLLWKNIVHRLYEAADDTVLVELKKALEPRSGEQPKYPLCLDVMNTTCIEVVKNSIDALVASFLTNPNYTTQLNMVFTLSLTHSGLLALRISDNGGGFSEQYLNDIKEKLENKENISWLTQRHNSAKKSDDTPCYFFGGYGLGNNLLYALMLHGVAISGDARVNQRYDFSSQPSTSVTLSNKTSSIGVGAEITLTSPLEPIAEALVAGSVKPLEGFDSVSFFARLNDKVNATKRTPKEHTGAMPGLEKKATGTLHDLKGTQSKPIACRI